MHPVRPCLEQAHLLRLLFLGTRPSRGTLLLFGEDMSGAARERLALLRRKIGIVFQDFRLVDHLSVRENVALPLRVARGTGSPVNPIAMF